MPSHVVCLPGAAGAPELWNAVVDRLPPEWKVTTLGFPGAGAQPHDPAISGYDDLVEHIAARIPDGSDVVAHSMGGAVAIGVMLACPNKVRRVVLVATSGGFDVATDGAACWRAEYVDEFPAAASWVTSDRPDYGGRLGGITAPACLIWGDADPISPLAAGMRLAAQLPCSVLHTVRGGTHQLVIDRAAEVARLIEAHLDPRPAM